MGAGTTRGWVTVIKLSRITTLSLSGIAVMNAGATRYDEPLFGLDHFNRAFSMHEDV